MEREQIIRMAREAGWPHWDGDVPTDDHEFEDFTDPLTRFAALVAAAERECIAKMFDEPIHLVPFVQNHLGGCMVCGFTPKMAAAAIRARSNT